MATITATDASRLADVKKWLSFVSIAFTRGVEVKILSPLDFLYLLLIVYSYKENKNLKVQRGLRLKNNTFHNKCLITANHKGLMKIPLDTHRKLVADKLQSHSYNITSRPFLFGEPYTYCSNIKFNVEAYYSFIH